MTTIKDIAREAGYSVSTVSRALSGHPDVSPTALARINEVIEARRYVRNRYAQNLKLQVSNTIGIITKGQQNMMFASIVERMQRRIEQAQLTASVEYVAEAEDEVAKATVFAREAKPRGLVFLGGDLANFQRGFENVALPAVLVTGSAKGLGIPQLSSVYADDAAGAAAAIDHLWQNGHRRIAVVGGHPEISPISALRLAGCQQALARHGTEVDTAKWFAASLYTLQGGYEAMNLLLDRALSMTAVFCMSDIMAIGARRALADRGLRVPDDVSLVGYDGLEVARYLTPRLTTISQQPDLLASHSIQVLLERVAKPLPAVNESVPHLLIPGESVRAI